jgi:hypothetical protein
MQFTKASAQAKSDAARSRNPALYDRLISIAEVKDFGQCWPVTCGKTHDGYGQIRVNGPKRRAHRVMFSLFYPDVPAVVVRHTCNNPACINPAHLRAGTQKDNAEDRMNSGRGGDLRGEKNGRAVLTVARVQEIRASAESAPALAARFGLTRQTIHAIRKRRIWKHI